MERRNLPAVRRERRGSGESGEAQSTNSLSHSETKLNLDGFRWVAANSTPRSGSAAAMRGLWSSRSFWTLGGCPAHESSRVTDVSRTSWQRSQRESAVGSRVCRCAPLRGRTSPCSKICTNSPRRDRTPLRGAWRTGRRHPLRQLGPLVAGPIHPESAAALVGYDGVQRKYRRQPDPRRKAINASAVKMSTTTLKTLRSWSYESTRREAAPGWDRSGMQTGYTRATNGLQTGYKRARSEHAAGRSRGMGRAVCVRCAWGARHSVRVRCRASDRIIVNV